MSSITGQPSVQVTYWINGEQTEQRTLDASNTSVAIVGLLPGQDANVKVCFTFLSFYELFMNWSSFFTVCSFDQSEPGDFRYSGRHDSDVLPPPKEGGPMALMIGCVQKAKKLNDEYLTSIIEKEKDEIPHKKSKHDGE